MRTAIRSRWPEVRALFETALGVAGGEREAWVRARAPDAEVCDAVLAMLADEPATLASIGGAGDAPAVPPGATLGSYRVLRTLGRGGMGVVYLAEQQHPRRLVAIKLIAGRHDAAALARFRREADVLALLSHPGIARVVEVDEDDGRPFLVMEYVDGVPLAEHAVALGRGERMELLARIADAVGHAHARGVVHRDLKPSNILVANDGQPKVVDFGIASLAALGGESLTETGMLLGTPSYMAPEQAAGEQRIDARADVYALGAIGFELLTQRLPLPVAGLAPLQALRLLKEATPPPLGRVDRTLRGDLERVFAKAMARERELRYANASALADDLRRWRASEPIHARPPGAWRRVRLFGRRNPVQLALALATAASLVAGLVMSLWFAWGQAQARSRAVVEAQRAQAERDRAQATLHALGQLFSAGNPTVAGHPDVLFREALASAARHVRGQPASVRAPVLLALAEAQRNIGANTAAIATYAEAAEVAEAAGDARTRLRARLRRAGVLRDHAGHREFAAAYDELRADPALRADPLVHAALLELKSREERWLGHHRTHRQLLDAAAALLPTDVRPDDATLRAEIETQLALERTRILSAEAGMRAAVDAHLVRLRSSYPRLRDTLGEEHPYVVRLRLLVDTIPALMAGRGSALDGLIEETRRKVQALGPAHPAVLGRIDLGLDLYASVTDARAIAAVQRLAVAAVRALPSNSRWRAITTARLFESPLAGVMADAFAAEEVQAVADARCLGVGLDDIDCLDSRLAVARALWSAGRRDEAIAAFEAIRDALPPDSDRMKVVLVNNELQRYLRHRGRYDEAARAADAAIAATEANEEWTQAERDIAVYRAAWGYRPRHCARALAAVEPRLARIEAVPSLDRDPLVRFLSTCEVRAGRDPAPALARLDAAWRELAEPTPPTSLIRMELVLAYLEVHDVLGRDAEFARWARELRTMKRLGLPLEQFPLDSYEYVERALAQREAGEPR